MLTRKLTRLRAQRIKNSLHRQIRVQRLDFKRQLSVTLSLYLKSLGGSPNGGSHRLPRWHRTLDTVIVLREGGQWKKVHNKIRPTVDFHSTMWDRQVPRECRKVASSAQLSFQWLHITANYRSANLTVRDCLFILNHGHDQTEDVVAELIRPLSSTMA